MIFEPALLQFADGSRVTPETWDRRRKEMIDILCREEYGYPPAAPACVKGKVTDAVWKTCSGHANLETVELSMDVEKGEFIFPIRFFAPNDGKAHPLFLLLNFRPDPYDMYFPAEEIIDNGFALAVLYYRDVTSDDADMTDKLAGLLTRPADGTGWGKITLWAWAASRAIDYLASRPEVDDSRIAVIGHSRLGKAALWCGALDERVLLTCSNDSGCSGAAYDRLKHPGSETVEIITKNFPFWFCENYKRYVNKPDRKPFDQHFLLAAVAPRYACVGSASKDDWADQYGEQLSCIGASPAWQMLGREGFSGKTEPAQVGETFDQGDIAYHLRDGIHFLGRADWRVYMDFFKKLP